jgi:hypothetical protein
MSRSGYSDDSDGWSLICWRGAVQSAIRGKRGQTFFKDLLSALDELPTKRLIADELVKDGDACALGVLGIKRGIDIAGVDPEDSETISTKFDIAGALAREVAYMNDEAGKFNETPEERFVRVRSWVERQISIEERSTEGLSP